MTHSKRTGAWRHVANVLESVADKLAQQQKYYMFVCYWLTVDSRKKRIRLRNAYDPHTPGKDTKARVINAVDTTRSCKNAQTPDDRIPLL